MSTDILKDKIIKYTKGISERVELIPVTLVDAAIAMKITKLELQEYLDEHSEDKETNNFLDVLKNTFYKFCIENKISKGIDLYIKNEFSSEDQLKNFKVILDVDTYQKQLQPFSINAEPVKIQNEEDQITTIENKEDIGIEIIEEADE